MLEDVVFSHLLIDWKMFQTQSQKVTTPTRNCWNLRCLLHGRNRSFSRRPKRLLPFLLTCMASIACFQPSSKNSSNPPHSPGRFQKAGKHQTIHAVIQIAFLLRKMKWVKLPESIYFTSTMLTPYFVSTVKTRKTH